MGNSYVMKFDGWITPGPSRGRSTTDEWAATHRALSARTLSASAAKSSFIRSLKS